MKQPEALRLAAIFEGATDQPVWKRTAAELRRQHELIAELVEALDRLMNGTTSLHDAMQAAQQARAALSKAKEHM